MLDEIQRTGSISQDALRLGFQTTCRKGLEVLLGVDDITTEACEAFKERHINDVKETVKNFSDIITKELNADIYEPAYEIGYYFGLPGAILSTVKQVMYERKFKKQKRRTYKIDIIKVEEPELDIEEGVWTTDIKYYVYSPEWPAYARGKHIKLDEVDKTNIYTVNTPGQKCYLKFIPYDNYSERLIPDEAVQAAYEATVIGMKRLRVVKPDVRNAVDKDPIIIGFVEDQMFIIAWFGYDKKDPMACNV